MSSLNESMRVVIDAGSHSTKAGFAYESSPRSMIYTTVGRFRHAGLYDGVPLVCCGNEAIKQQGILNLVWPMRNGLISDWDEMEKLWHHVFYKELKVPPEQCSLMHTVHTLVPRKDKLYNKLRKVGRPSSENPWTTIGFLNVGDKLSRNIIIL